MYFKKRIRVNFAGFGYCSNLQVKHLVSALFFNDGIILFMLLQFSLSLVCTLLI